MSEKSQAVGAPVEPSVRPLSALRMKLRHSVCDGAADAWTLRMRISSLLEAPEWTQAAEETNALRTQLAHWKAFAVHAEGEHAAWKKARKLAR